MGGMRAIMLAVWGCLLAGTAAAQGCGPAIAAAERARGTAPGLLAAIGVVESGRMDARTGMRLPWPWTVTAEGVGTFYADKPTAIRAVEALRARGVTSIDVGCMQVNLQYHPAAFPTLDQAFDPMANAAYAARFLSSLFARQGGWPAAAAAYHSLIPERGAQYGRLVAAVWGGAPLPVVARSDGLQVVNFPGGGEMRILRDATGLSPGLAGGGTTPGRVLGYLSGP